MKRSLPVISLIVFMAAVFALLTQPATVQAQSDSPNGADKPLCLPGAYLSDPLDCLPLGPSQQITELARQGIQIPQRPLPAFKPEPELTVSPVTLARINLPSNEPAPLFSSFEDAVEGSNPTRFIAPGPTRYVSYIAVRYYNDKPYVRIKSGEWLRASPVAYSGFQGLVFNKTPRNSFGWIIDQAEVRVAPGYQSAKTNRVLFRDTVVQIYDVQEANNTKWYMIGPGQWVERRYIRQAAFNTTPPEGVTGDRWIELNLYEQVLMVYENRQLVFATLVASGGDPFFTRPGLHQIYEKKELETMSGAFEADRSDYYYLEDVPWTMYFDQKRALHGSYWRMWFGYPGTHGCVNLTIGDSKWLYEWAEVGDFVYVWDPSGETPTDPAFYGAGGA